MKRNNFVTQAVLRCGIILLLFMSGCYGGTRGIVRFDELDYPASMSFYLYGPNNEMLVRDRELVVIKQFRIEVNYPAIFYSLGPPTQASDVGKQINIEVESCGGDGVVNVKISSKPGLTNYMHPLTLLPFWPSYTRVIVEGDIVKYEPSLAQKEPNAVMSVKSGDVVIMEMVDETATVRLSEQCHVIGKIDTLFSEEYYSNWASNGQSWKTLRSAQRVDSGEKMTMQDFVKMSAQKRGANVVQTLYITFGTSEVWKKYNNAKKAMKEQGIIYSESVGVALDIRYWSCPINRAP